MTAKTGWSGTPWTAVRDDVASAVRSLIRRPALSASIIALFGTGVGATVAMFSVVRGVVLSPLDVPSPDALVGIGSGEFHEGSIGNVSAAAFLQMRDVPTFTSIAAMQEKRVTVQIRDDAREVKAYRVSPEMFDVLGMAVARGRRFNRSDAIPPITKGIVLGNAPRVIVSYEYWRGQLQGRDDVIGARMLVNDDPYEIVGVLPEGHAFPADAELLFPLGFGDVAPIDYGSFYLRVVARRANGVTMEQTNATLSALATRLASLAAVNKGLKLSAMPLTEVLTVNYRASVLLVFGASVFLLLLTCAGVASLLLVSATARTREFAVRMAVGASPRILTRQLLAETTVLAIVGAMLAAGVAAAGLSLLIALAPAGIRLLHPWTLDLRVLGSTLLVTLLVAVIVALLPALHARRADVLGLISGGGRGGSSGRAQRRALRLMAATQLGTTVVLLMASGALLQQYWKLQAVPLRFDPTNVSSSAVSLPRSRYAEAAQQAAFTDQVLARVKTMSGVEAAAAGVRLPVVSGGGGIWFRLPDNPQVPGARDPDATFNAISPEYFRVLMMEIRQGRVFDASDRQGGRPTIVVSEAFVRQHLHGNPIGQHVVLTPWPTEQREIVGVVADVSQGTVNADAQPALYVPLAQLPMSDLRIVARMRTDASAGVAAVGTAIHAIDARLGIGTAAPLATLVADTMKTTRFALTLVVVFAILGLALASAAIYAFNAFAVAQRTDEIGIRCAVGATPAAIRRLFVSETGSDALITTALALVLAQQLIHSFGDRAIGTHGLSVLLIGGVTAISAIVVVLAAIVPVRQAARLDPALALRGIGG